MPSSRLNLLLRGACVAALPAFFSIGCGNTDSAPGVTDDPSVYADAEVDPVQAEDGGTRPPPSQNPVPIGGGRNDAGHAPLDGGGSNSDAGVGDAATIGDARSPAELGALLTVERLLVADGKSARVHALDVNTRDFLESIDLNGAGPIYASADGRYGFALEGAQNQVQVVNMGLGDLSAAAIPKLTSPSLERASLTGLGPSAFGAHGDRVVILFAGASQLQLFDGEGISTAQAKDSASVSSSASAPAVLIDLGDRFVVSERQASGSGQLRVLDDKLDFTTRPELDCTDPEGWAITQDTVAVGCNDRVLLWNTTQTSATHVDYPASLSGERAHKLVANSATSAFLTMLGTKLCLVNTEVHCVDAPEGVIDYMFDAAGKRALLLSRDGHLHVLDAETLDALDKVSVFDALPLGSPEGELPGLAVGRRNVYVSQPARERVLIIDSASATDVGEIPVPGGFPTKITVFKYPI
jgi:hypothetical protein